MEKNNFIKVVWAHYKKHGRKLPWRFVRTSARGGQAYRIFVSEIMLQQTQVDRVIPKYTSFVKKFPNFEKLGRAPLKKVLLAWQGLGYNRRALNLKRAAEIILSKHAGALPRSYDDLVALPGVGPYTAKALRTFVWNEPEVFIETNIRSVFIHHFFSRSKKVSDAKLMPLIKKTLDTKNPREWYYALMDYGSHLKRTNINPSRKSAHHTKQSKFEGSRRELRGAILRMIHNQKTITVANIEQKTFRLAQGKQKRSVQEIKSVLNDLQKEGFIKYERRCFHIA